MAAISSDGTQDISILLDNEQRMPFQLQPRAKYLETSTATKRKSTRHAHLHIICMKIFIIA